MLKQENMSMTMSVLRSWFFPGLVQLALGSVLLAAEQAPEPWAAKPLGPRIEPALFVPAPIKRELHAALKVRPGKGADVVLVDAGRPTCVLMLADQASRAAAEAAAELQAGLRKMSGAEVLIVRESALTLKEQSGQWSISHKGQSFASLVAVGDTRLAAGQSLAGKDLPLEGYRIKSVGNVLFLVGSDMRPDNRAPLSGSRHAAVALLERHLGFRWLWPGELGEVVPRHATVNVAAVDEEDAPAIRKRNLRNYAYGRVEKVTVPADSTQPGFRRTQKLQLRHERLELGMKALGLTSEDYVGWCGQATVWWDHQRLGSSYETSAGHAYGGWWNRFGAEHPEWFALQGSGYRTPGKLPAQREQLCYSNPGLVQQVIREKIAEFERNPGRESASISPNDGGGNNSPCLCEACRRLDPVNGRPMELGVYVDGQRKSMPYVALSDRIFTFYNRVAEGVAKVYPDKLLGTYAYSSYRDVPLGVRPHPNLLVGFVGLGYWDDAELELDRQRWEQWAGVAKNLFLRPNAFHQGHGMPGVFVTKLDHDIKRCYQTGMIVADFDSVLHHWATQGLNYYVLARLLWDPSQHAEAIVHDYCKKGFGPAAGLIRRYFRELEEVTDRCAATNEAKGNDAAGGELRKEEQAASAVKRGDTYLRLALSYTPEVISKLRRTLAEARLAAGQDERVKQRIAFLEAGLRYGELTASAHRMFFARQLDQAQLAQLLNERRTVFQELVRNQPLAVNVAHIAWREGGMWKRHGWNWPTAAAAKK